MPTLSEMLKVFRLSKGLTQNEAAKEMHIGRTALANYEQGTREPDLETLEIIADYYNCNIDTLIGKQAYTEAQKSPLTADERELLELYRAANQQGRVAAKAVLRAALPQDASLSRSAG